MQPINGSFVDETEFEGTFILEVDSDGHYWLCHVELDDSGAITFATEHGCLVLNGEEYEAKASQWEVRSLRDKKPFKVTGLTELQSIDKENSLPVPPAEVKITFVEEI